MEISRLYNCFVLPDIGVFAIVFGIIGLIILVRLIAGGFDTDRIAGYFNQDGKEFISKEWAPFGKGWFGEKSDRIYLVKYKDRDGHLHQAYCKTSMFSGVYITDDQIIEYNNEAFDDTETLKAENEKLKEEIKKLRDKQG